MKVVILKQGIHGDVGEDDPHYPDACTEITSSVVLLKAENDKEENTIVDTGNWGYEEEILAALEKEDLKPDDIKWIVNTHYHYDHISNHYLFKKANRVAKNGINFPDKSGYWHESPDQLKELPWIKIIQTPGHCPDHRSIVVKSEGKTYIIAGDAIQEEYMRTGKFGVPKNQDYIDSAKKIVDMTDVIIPGHGKAIQGKDLEEFKEIVYNMKVKK